VGQRGRLAPLARRLRERLPTHALEIPQVREVVDPLRVTRIIGVEPRRIGVRVEQLVRQRDERCDRLARGVGKTTHRPVRSEAHTDRDATAGPEGGDAASTAGRASGWGRRIPWSGPDGVGGGLE
jgi:hypothetical protein